MPAVAERVCPWNPHALGSERGCPECDRFNRDQSRAEAKAKLDAWREKMASARRDHPDAAALADALAELQPRWAEAEECEVDVLMVLDALRGRGLRLQRDE